MVKIVVKREDEIIKDITFKGHAMSDVKGRDIVCASISSMLIITVNAILEFDESAISYEEKKEFYLTNLKKDEITNTLLSNLVNHLKELSLTYKKNIQIKEEQIWWRWF